jgi:enoyl-CoA hydratase
MNVAAENGISTTGPASLFSRDFAVSSQVNTVSRGPESPQSPLPQRANSSDERKNPAYLPALRLSPLNCHASNRNGIVSIAPQLTPFVSKEFFVSAAPHLLTEVVDGILIATLNRPDKLNALSDQTMELFEQALLRFRDTPDLKVLLIRSTGRYFCSGADLKEGAPHPVRRGSAIRETHRLRNRNMHRIYDEMEHIEKPIVVAHHAMCVGGGLEMSLSCDFRLAAKSAGYSFPEGLMGMLPASNGVSRLTRICGPHWARWLVMANKKVTADKALVMGLVHEVFPDETFAEDVMAFCRHLAQQHGEQMGTAKIAIEMANDVGLDMARHVERMANSALMLDPAYLEGIEKYIRSVGGKR